MLQPKTLPVYSLEFSSDRKRVSLPSKPPAVAARQSIVQIEKTVLLTGKAIVNFHRVIQVMDDEEAAELVASNDLLEAQILEEKLLDIKWTHDDVDIKVAP